MTGSMRNRKRGLFKRDRIDLICPIRKSGLEKAPVLFYAYRGCTGNYKYDLIRVKVARKTPEDSECSRSRVRPSMNFERQSPTP